MAEDRNMDMPQISRSGRVVKKSAKVKEMEDFDINELDVQGKSRKKSKTDGFDEFEDRRVAPIKIPKISLNMQGGLKKVAAAGKPQIFKASYEGSLKMKQHARHSIYNDSSDASKESDSSSISSESSSSSPTSSDISEDEDSFPPNTGYEGKQLICGPQAVSVHSNKVIVEPQQYDAPVSYMEQSSEMSSDDSEDAASDPALVIAEDSDNSAVYAPKGVKGNTKKRGGKKDTNCAPQQVVTKQKPVARNTDTNAVKEEKSAPTARPPSAYMLWCSENRKKIVSKSGNIGSGNIGKKMGVVWQALPEKEKMIWRRKAKQLALQSTENITNAGPSHNSPTKIVNKVTPNHNEESLKNLTESTCTFGTAPVDASAHLKLLGDSLTVIGQRLIEHEGQLAVSGIYSVLLDTLLCAIGPLICLTSEITGLENVPSETFKKTLDHIAYFMPGL